MVDIGLLRCSTRCRKRSGYRTYSAPVQHGPEHAADTTELAEPLDDICLTAASQSTQVGLMQDQWFWLIGGGL